ncbi:IS200/IS605 family accessory protein TnpB-related protein (plasmid) [Pseudomonas sp. FeN3W]|nr:IS200/IS605 family accessory protein TnpB-related protein [Pseudomonas sp. FeN3W]
MIKSLPTRITTIQTRLPRDTDLSVVAALDAYAELFSRLERVAIATRTKGEKVDKKAFLKQHGITGRQFNALIRSVDGKIDSQLSNLENYIEDCRVKIAGQNVRISKKLGLIDQPRWAGKTERLHQAVRQHRIRINHLEARKAGYERQVEAKRPSICMGSRRLFRQQFNLIENGLNNHAEWLELWRRERSSQFFVLGSKDESSGCQGCVIIPQGDGIYTLKLRLPDALKEIHGEYCYITDIRFGHDQRWIYEAITANRLRKVALSDYRKQAKDTEFVGPLNKESRFLDAYGQAMSYRFVRDEKRGWRILVTTERSGQVITTDRRNGAIGIDLNNHHLAMTEVDWKGNKVGCADHVFRFQDNITSPATTTRLQMAAVEIVAQAKRVGKPVVIENLDFSFKKSSMQKGKASDAKLNKVVSSLVYRKFRQIIETRAFKEGVEVIAVNPAFTSFIGKLKYLNQTKNSAHQAAGLVIARRGMGLGDRLPRTSVVPVMRRPCTFQAPVDARKDEAKCLKKAMSAYGKWYTSTRAEARKRTHVFRLQLSARLESIPF